jgi:hypothetical protein
MIEHNKDLSIKIDPKGENINGVCKMDTLEERISNGNPRGKRNREKPWK